MLQLIQIDFSNNLFLTFLPNTWTRFLATFCEDILSSKSKDSRQTKKLIIKYDLKWPIEVVIEVIEKRRDKQDIDNLNIYAIWKNIWKISLFECMHLQVAICTFSFFYLRTNSLHLFQLNSFFVCRFFMLFYFFGNREFSLCLKLSIDGD